MATHTILYYAILTIYGIKYSMMKIELNSTILYSTILYYTLLYYTLPYFTIYNIKYSKVNIV